MRRKNKLLIINKYILNFMIQHDNYYDSKEILKQSRRLDKYITFDLKEQMKNTLSYSTSIEN